MNKKKWIAATVAACMVLPAWAQSQVTAPPAEAARQARENARRDAKLADDMEKARLREEAKPVSAYIPKQEPAPETPALKHPEVFSAKVPGSGKKPKEKAPKKSPKKEAKPAKTAKAEQKPQAKAKKQPT